MVLTDILIHSLAMVLSDIMIRTDTPFYAHDPREQRHTERVRVCCNDVRTMLRADGLKTS